MRWMSYPAFMCHGPRQVRWPSPKSMGWGQTLLWERKQTSINKWYSLWQGRRGNWRLETERTVRSGLPDRSYDFASRVEPTTEHRIGLCRIKCPKPKSFLPPIPASSPCACPPTGSQRQESYSVSLQVSFLGQRAGWKTLESESEEANGRWWFGSSQGHYNLIHNMDINVVENVPQAFLINQQLLRPK